MSMRPQAPPFGPLIGSSFDRGFTITARYWMLFLITAVAMVLAGFANFFLALAVLMVFLTYWFFASLANTIRLTDPGYRMNADVVTRLIGVGFLYGLIVDVGFLLFIVPGIYVANKLSLAPVIVAKEDCGVMEALGRSWSLTDSFFWPTLWFNILAAFAVAAVAFVGYAIGAAVVGAIMAQVVGAVGAGIQPQTPFALGGLLGAGLSLAYAIYGLAIAYTYQAKDIALYNWYDGLHKALAGAEASA